MPPSKEMGKALSSTETGKMPPSTEMNRQGATLHRNGCGAILHPPQKQAKCLLLHKQTRNSMGRCNGPSTSNVQEKG